jgi:hypothetical protein
MTPEEFVKGFYLEKKALIDLYLDSNSGSDVAMIISSLNLDQEKTERLRQILNGTLRDVMYSILLGLDGEANIGGWQELLKITDQEGNELTGGEIESFAWEYFHNNKYEFDKRQADFIASLTYRTTEQGSRKTAAKSGYRPQVKFDFTEMQTSGQQTFIDREFVFPGDSVDAEIKILSVDFFANSLTEGMDFEFREGSTIIGTGKIKHIINDKLKKTSS